MTSLAIPVTRPRAGHIHPRATVSRVRPAAIAAIVVVRPAWRGIADDGQLGPSVTSLVGRSSGARV